MTRLCVYGLWHLGSVTAAVMAEHFPTVGLDPDLAVVDGLREGRPPIFEPGLEELVRAGLAAGRLEFTAELGRVAAADVVWVAFDTPVDQEDRADVDLVVRQVERLFPHLADGALVLLSSQLPVGTTARLEAAFATVARGRRVEFAYSPENLRLGKAIEVFRKADRIVVGTRTTEARARIEQLLSPLGRPILWVSTESAEMTKHAVNAFLATSVVFINEIAAACEATGADAKEVERGLKSESRIGPGAYLGPGAAFAGRDARSRRRLLAGNERAARFLDAALGRRQAEQRRSPGVGPAAAGRAPGGAARQNHRRPGPHLQTQHRYLAAIGVGGALPLVRRRGRARAGPRSVDSGEAGRACPIRCACVPTSARRSGAPTRSSLPPSGPPFGRSPPMRWQPPLHGRWSSTPIGSWPRVWRRTLGSVTLRSGPRRANT